MVSYPDSHSPKFNRYLSFVICSDCNYKFTPFLFLCTPIQARLLEGFQINMCVIKMKSGSLIFFIGILHGGYHSDLPEKTN